ncbi:hypothetical protein EYR40_004774 [Pleurotus pulmonarius]|nr:hypothetical protein EYR36_006848 [Pleurotus pulmonarius]KAF4601539.1 hypothetical protein EYR38_006193 [Pleurotus pulmonarius]KAF4601576.1 hypothetical protein EYR40_004774 [Pleurotus pulmonarius]
MSTVMNTALAIPELLRRIFEYGTRHDNYSNVLVSKAWSDEAIPVLWRCLDSLWPLLSLLGPLKLVLLENGERRYRFRRPIRSSDWATFSKYAWCIHELRSIRRKFDFCDSVVSDIGISRPTSSILPNLRCFHYIGGSTPFLPLLVNTQSLREFVVRMDCTTEEIMQRRTTLTLLHALAPNLEVLRLCVSTLDDVVCVLQVNFAEVLTSLPHCRELILPPSFLCPCLLRALSALPHLKSLRASRASFEGDETQVSMSPIPNDHGFQSLANLELDDYSYNTVASILKSYNPHSITKLAVGSFTREAHGGYVDLFSAISASCPSIEEITISNGWREVEPDTEEPPRYHSSMLLFEPLFRCSYMTSLTLNNSVPLYLDVGAMTELVKAFPNLRVLRLFEEATTPPTLPLSSLATLAPLCPNMEHLALNMDTSGITAPPHDENLILSGVQFRRLKVLDVGLSTLRSPAPVADQINIVSNGTSGDAETMSVVENAGSAPFARAETFI